MKTNRTLIFIITITFSILLNSCEERTRKIDTHKTNLLFVLCDLTASIDTAYTKKHILKTSQEIFHSIPAYTEYHFIPITASPERDLFHGNTAYGEDTETVYLNNLKTYISQQKQLEEQYNKRQSDRTCIISAIESVTETLNSISKVEEKHDKINLIIISDMMEYCSVNHLFLNMEKRPFDTLTARKVIAGWPKDKRFLNRTKKLHITVLFNSKNNAGYSDIKSFWKQFFKAAGYANEVSFITDFNPGVLD